MADNTVQPQNGGESTETTPAANGSEGAVQQPTPQTPSEQPPVSANPYNPYAPQQTGQQPYNPYTPPIQNQQAPDPRMAMPNNQPEPNRQYPNTDPGYQAVRKAQNMALAASICGPVSVLIGGMLLSGAGIVCALVGMRRADKIQSSDARIQEATKRVRKSCIIAMVVCAVAFVLNMLYAFYMFPIVMEAAQTGDFSAILGGSTGSGNSSSAPGTSTWG